MWALIWVFKIKNQIQSSTKEVVTFTYLKIRESLWTLRMKPPPFSIRRKGQKIKRKMWVWRLSTFLFSKRRIKRCGFQRRDRFVIQITSIPRNFTWPHGSTYAPLGIKIPHLDTKIRQISTIKSARYQQSARYQKSWT